jgi:hypothetical protein
MVETYDVALSFSADDAWMATDIATLLKRYGFSAYCSKSLPDRAGGQLRKKLRDIYRNSGVNVLLWTPSYAAKARDSVVFMERQLLWDRHIGKSDFDTLLIASCGMPDVPDDYDECLTHSVESNGLVGIADFCIDRLISLRSSYEVGSITMSHPKGSEIQRGQILPCKIRVNESYQTDSLGRWKKLGDLEVSVSGMNDSYLKNYLIPSGSAPSYLSHSTLLKHRTDCLKIKKTAGSAFAEKFGNVELDAVRFFIELNGMKFPHVYCPEYDAFLNSNMGAV